MIMNHLRKMLVHRIATVNVTLLLLCTAAKLTAASWTHLQSSLSTSSSKHIHHHPRGTLSLFASPKRYHPSSARAFSHRRRTIAAAIMTPSEDANGVMSAVSEKEGASTSSATHPNWRVVDPKANQEDKTICSPFCHPLSLSSNHNNQSSPSATAAPWSPSALTSALDLYNRISTCTDPYIGPQLKSALHDMEMAYRLYGPYCMVGSYNGGKDAVVIFHLMRAVHAHYCNEMSKTVNDDDESSSCRMMIPRPRVIYFQHPDEFPEVLSLLDDTVELFDVDMLAFKEGVSFGEGLKHLVERNIAPGKDGLSFYGSNGDNSEQTLPPPHPLAFVLGTRKNDPNAGSQGIYAPSSHYMPPFLRVNPILDWTYGHVWHFLRFFELPYCSLYDDGYTSLGTVKNTLPCPALKKEDGENGEEYWPAYMLRDWDLERAGRIDKKKPPKQEKKETDDDVETTEEEGAASESPEVTMSQTSSTVSLPSEPQQNDADVAAELKNAYESMSVINIDDNNDDPPAHRTTDLSNIGQQPTVGLIVIGDELLKGMTPDSNVLSAAKALRSNNVSLDRVSIISDDGQGIVEEIRRFSKEVDVIITSGGVGPTHDDVTIKSVGEALGLDMEMNYEMAELLIEKMGSKAESNGGDDGGIANEKDPRKVLERQLSVGQQKMSTLPTSSVLQYITDDSSDWPVLQVQNIFILPGVPTFFEKKINDLAAYLPAASSSLAHSKEEAEAIGLNVDQESQTNTQQSSPPPRSDTYRIVLSLEEESIVSALNASVAAHPHVSFGSYPIVDHPEYKTIITLEGRFYNGGYTKGSQRLLGKSIADKASGHDGNQAQSLFFTKEEMNENVQNALGDIKSRLPEEGILCIDNCEDLLIK